MNHALLLHLLKPPGIFLELARLGVGWGLCCGAGGWNQARRGLQPQGSLPGKQRRKQTIRRGMRALGQLSSSITC